MTFTRAFIDSMKRWAPLCGLGHVQGWLAAEKSARHRPRTRDRLPDQIPHRKAPTGVPPKRQRTSRHRLTLTDAKNRRHDASASQNTAALVSSTRTL